MIHCLYEISSLGPKLIVIPNLILSIWLFQQILIQNCEVCREI